MKKVKKTQKPSRSEELTALTVRTHKDFSSYEVLCRMAALESSIRENEGECDRLQARLKELRNRLEADRAEVRGLELVIVARG
jgi:molecular chaperone GrpE (heat shock protein)